MVVVAAAVQTGHENHRAPEGCGGAYRARGKQRRTSEEAHDLRRRIRDGAVGEHANELALIKAVADPQHRLEVPERNDFRRTGRVGGFEKRGDPAGVVLVHRHRHAQTRAAPAQGAHDLEAPQVRAEQKRPAAARDRVVHEFFALGRDLEQAVALPHQVEAIENGRGKGKHLPVAVDGAGLAPERPSQVLARAAARAGREREEVGRDDMQDAVRHGTAAPQRQEDHYPDEGRAAALGCARPLRGARPRAGGSLNRPGRHHAARRARSRARAPRGRRVVRHSRC